MKNNIPSGGTDLSQRFKAAEMKHKIEEGGKKLLGLQIRLAREGLGIVPVLDIEVSGLGMGVKKSMIKIVPIPKEAAKAILAQDEQNAARLKKAQKKEHSSSNEEKNENSENSE